MYTFLYNYLFDLLINIQQLYTCSTKVNCYFYQRWWPRYWNLSIFNRYVRDRFFFQSHLMQYRTLWVLPSGSRVRFACHPDARTHCALHLLPVDYRLRWPRFRNCALTGPNDPTTPENKQCKFSLSSYLPADYRLRSPRFRNCALTGQGDLTKPMRIR